MISQKNWVKHSVFNHSQPSQSSIVRMGRLGSKNSDGGVTGVVRGVWLARSVVGGFEDVPEVEENGNIITASFSF